MDIASLIGIITGLICLGIVGQETSNGHWGMFYSLEGVLMVFGGSISVSFMAMPMEKIKCVAGFLKAFMFHRGKNPIDLIKLLCSLSEKSRRDGMLALEPELKEINQTMPFLATGLRMMVDGMGADVVESTLRLEIMAMQERHKAGKKFFDLIKLYGPGWGLVGTLVGQIGMFGNLSSGDVGVMGHSLAVAVAATMYGCVLANAIAGPIGDKLALRSSDEIINREMTVQGLMSIQGGDSPRVTFDKLLVFLPMPVRSKVAATPT